MRATGRDKTPVMRWLVIVCGVTGCIGPGAVPCDNGRTCPAGTTCIAAADIFACARQDQIAACEGLADGDACATPGICQGGACLPACGDGVQSDNEECDCGTVANPTCALPNGDADSGCSDTCKLRYCGNAIVDPGETCDDGNFENDDTCALDCKSNVTCGNGYVDAAVGEICDDGNPIDHDGCSPACKLEVPQWHAWQSPWTPRTGHAAAFDTMRGKLVIANGSSDNYYHFADSWVRESSGGWMKTSSAPTRRGGAAMAFDSNRNMTVLFGGLHGAPLADTWESDGTTWTKKTPTVSPPGRYNAAMAFDPVRQRIVMFGGLKSTGAVAETWEYDGTTWVQVTSTQNPPSAYALAMAYDSARSNMVLFGGDALAGDTWERTGTQWAKVTTTKTPGQRTYVAMGYSTSSSRVVLFGGIQRNGFAWTAGETWEYDGDWTLVSTVQSPPPRADATLSSMGASLLLIGGSNYADGRTFDDVWRYDPWGTWVRETLPFAPSPRIPSPVYDVARQETLVFGGFASVADDTWTFDGIAWTLHNPATAPPPRALFARVYDPDRQRVVIFGGENGGVLGDVWEWDGTSWTARATTNTPSPRRRAAFGYHEKEHIAVMFGGDTFGSPKSETWELAGDTWTQTALTTHPNAEQRGTMVYDPTKERLIYFDNNNATWAYAQHAWTKIVPTLVGPSVDTANFLIFDPVRRRVELYIVESARLFELDDVDVWHEIDITGSHPPERYDTSGVWDDARRSIVMFGGASFGGILGDTWTLEYR